MDSSMVESVFDDHDASSDNFSPPVVAKPKTKATAKAAPKATAKKATTTTKTAPKKMLQTTLKAKSKPNTSKKRAKPATEDEDSEPDQNHVNDESLLSNTPPSAKKQKKAPTSKKAAGKPLQPIENETMSYDGASDPKPKKASSSTEQYQKLTQLEHIIKRPDTYIGSIERTDRQMWVYNTEMDSMEMRDVSYVPGLYKIFDEILVNAADNKQRDKNMDTVKVTVNREKGEISVLNNGRGIPIEIHEKENIYIPEMIFGHLLTSSNYDDDQQKVTGGRNGYGAKLCNVFSTEFILETSDSRSKKKYTQTWTNNMTNMGKAKITDNKGDDFTKVTFTPDFKKFGMTGMDDDFEALVKRRVYDLAGTSKGVKVYLNGEKIKNVRNFKTYMEMYTKAIKRERGEEASNDTSEIIVDSPDPRWEIGFAVSDGSFQQVSFVNSIATTSGGTHVNYVGDQICNKLIDIVKKKNKGGAALKINQIRNHIFLFVNCLIVNPAFTSQTKEQLTTKSSQFGSKCVVSDDFLKKVAKTEVVNNILHFAQQKADQILKKSDGSRRSRMSNPKLIDANKAGTKEGHHCTLILTEGDSAKALAVAGRSVVGPDLFGVFPLRGKLLNVRDASVDQISKNTEIQNIKTFLGLQHKKQYTDCKGLRYGHLMIMTDQDHDGSHIKGLLINFLQVAFPSLLRIPEFLIEFITPIVKIWKGDIKDPTQWKTFFTMPEYETFREEHRNEHWEHKYYKGLGTSTTEDAQIYFRDLDKHLKEFHTMQDHETDLIDLAFSKKKADERKEWLRQFKPGTFLDHTTKKITYTDFVNKELILFSMADNMRSIPSVVDGLKPGQRKVLYTCFKQNLKKDVKVVELAGMVSGKTAYQHGEVSLQQTIVGLAQTFVGSNNLNCLEPSGNFGSRLQGGSDSASARYIYTRLSPFARRVFSPLDEPLLTYNTDDDKTIEPEMYVPVVPLVLINGADGIGTGWSSSIPNYNPEDIVKNLKLLMNNQPMEAMQPWFRGFTGTVTPMGPDRYKFGGIIKQTGDDEVEITELPIRVWTQDFKDRMEEIIKADKIPSFIKDYTDYNTHRKVHFVVQMEEKHMKIALEEGLEEKFKLSKSIATSNLVAFDPEGRITKYASVEDIMKEFFAVRIKFYEKRKQWQLAEMQKQLEKFSNQARFVQMIIDGKLVVSKKKKTDLVAELQQKKFKPFPKVSDAAKEGETEPVMEEPVDEVEASANSYDYLLGMAIWSLTQERVEKLLKQIGDKEVEIDKLIQMSKEDLWTKDLDDFLDEWRFQLADEDKRQRKVANLGRRASSKLKIGAKAPMARKRKAQGVEPDDSDFGVSKAKKPAVINRVQPKPGLLSHLTKPPASKKSSVKTEVGSKPVQKQLDDDVWIQLDGTGDAPAAATSSNGAAAVVPAKKAATTIKDDDDSAEEDEDMVKPVTTRQPRAASRKAIKYISSDDSDSDNGDNLLGDVSKMVKGFGGGLAEPTPGGRTLFSTSMSRPGSSAGLPKSNPKTSKPHVGLSDDETDYSKLAPPPSFRTSAAITAKALRLSEDEGDSFSEILSNPVSKAAKPVAKEAPKPVTKASTTIPKSKKAPAKKVAPAPAAAPAKKPPLSPAAKAYAAKHARGKKRVVNSSSDDDAEDEVDTIANDILDSPPAKDVETSEPSSPEPAPAAARPSRRAATTAKKAAYVIEDDDSEAESSGGNDFSEDFSDGE